MAVTISTIEGDDVVNAAEAGSASFFGSYSPFSISPTVTYQIYNSSNVVVLSGGAGESFLLSTWSIDLNLTTLPDGAYTFVADYDDDGAGGTTSRAFTLDKTPPSAPTVDLAASDDSGSSSTDNLTNVVSGLSITGSGETGATVTVFNDSNNNGKLDFLEGSWTSTVSGGTYGVDISLFDLFNQDGAKNVRAFQTDKAGNQSATSALTITIDTKAPSVNGGSSFSVNENTTAPVQQFTSNEAVTWSLSGVDAADFVVSSDGKLSFVTPPDFENPTDGDLTGIGLFERNNVYTLDVIATDKAGNSRSELIFVTVKNVNENTPPVGVADSYTAVEDTTLVISAANGVLANDTDANKDTLTAAVVAGPTNGTLTLNADGSFSYKGKADYNGPDSFTYTASDGKANSATTTVSLNVTAVNDAPVGVADSYMLSEDTTLTGASVLGNDTDVDNTNAQLTAVLVANVTNGTLVLNPNGTFNYTPKLNFFGADSFTYTVKDAGGAESATTTVTLDVAAVNDAPVGEPDSYTVSEDSSLTVVAPGILGNDSDPEGSVLTIQIGSGPEHGVVSVNPDGSFTYTPDANYNGPDSFVYLVRDAEGLPSGKTTVSLTVTPVNDAPVANPDSYTTAEDTPLVITAPGILANDSDPEGSVLTIQIGSGPEHGTLAQNPDGSFTYTPDANYNGPDSFVYLVRDAEGLPSGKTTVSLTVTPVNDAPEAPAAQSVSTNEDTPTGPISFKATDVDGDTLTYSYNGEGAGPQLGSLSIDQAAGTFSFTPNANANGVETLKFLISDGQGGVIEQTVTLTVNPINDPPTAPGEKAINVVEDTASGPVAIGAADIDGDTLTYSLIEGGPAKGTVTFDQAAGTFVYTPNPEASGTDSFRIMVSDGKGGITTQLVSVTISEANDPPTAVDDTLATRPEDGGAFTVAAAALLANDTSLPDVGETLTITAVGAAVGGTVSLTGGVITFTPTADFNGPASFQYTVSDGRGGTDVGVASFAVTPVDDAPVFSADAQTVSTPENQTAVGTFAATDADGGALTYSLTGQDAGLFVIDKATGALSFVAAPDFEAMPVNPVFVSVIATDSTGLSDQLNLTVQVSDVAESQPSGPPPVTPPPNPNPGGGEPDPQVLLNDAFRNIMRYPVNDEYRPRVDVLAGKVEDGDMTLEQAIGVIIDWADATTAVATMTYQFFTGKVPTFEGLDWLVAPDGPNPNSLNEDYYAKFNYDSRYINFAVNLGKNGLSGQAFALDYGGLTLAQATKAIYAEVFGFAASDVKVSELLNGLVPNGLGGTMTREAYLRNLGGDDIGAKAAMAGFLLGYAALTDEGVYGGVNEAFLLDIADGGTYDVNIVGVYEGGLAG